MAGIVPNNVIRIPCNKHKLFRYWLEFLTPFHHMTDREIDVATAYLVKRQDLSKLILDSELINKNLFSEETSKEIREACGLSNSNFQVMKGKLKQKKFFINGQINPRLIPNIKENQESFQLVLVFEYGELK